MVAPRRHSRSLGATIAVAAAGIAAIAGCSAVSLPGVQTTHTGSPSAPGIPAGAFEATVTYVHDGDTLYLENGGSELKVRLIGIDTPELESQDHPNAGECYGEEARELLRDFLPEGTTVWALEDRESEDHYGRSLLYVYLNDGTFVNLAMIELGAAESLKVGLNDRFWPQLRNAEDEAYAAQLGMWGSC